MSAKVKSGSIPLDSNAKLIAQGAEAKLYKIDCEDGKTVLAKYRIRKDYRIPGIENSLFSSRFNREVKIMTTLLSGNLEIPALHMVDPKEKVIYMEYIDGVTMSDYIARDLDLNSKQKQVLNPLFKKIGKMISSMHNLDTIHGDLTTSNIILKTQTLQPVLIDFGLGEFCAQLERKAVDLHVFERAIRSAHPEICDIFEVVLESYLEHTNSKKEEFAKRLEQVRARGRKL